MTTPSDSTQNTAGNQPAPPTPSFEVPEEVHKMYKDTTVFIRDKFFPHYNLYQVNRQLHSSFNFRESCYKRK